MRDEVFDCSIEVLGKGDNILKSDTNNGCSRPTSFRKLTSMYSAVEFYANLK
jgi:hypothetical protein